MEQPYYTTAEVSQISGFSLRRLDYWARESIVVPSFQQAHGSGSRRLYTLDDLVQINFIRQLKKYGWSTQKIHKAITTLREIMDDSNPLKSAILLHGKDTIFALSKSREGERVLLDALSSTGQLVMNFVLETLIEETQRLADEVNIAQSLYMPEMKSEEVQAGGVK